MQVRQRGPVYIYLDLLPRGDGNAGRALLVRELRAGWRDVARPGDDGNLVRARRGREDREGGMGRRRVEDQRDSGQGGIAVDRRGTGAAVDQVQAKAARLEAGDRPGADQDLALP